MTEQLDVRIGVVGPSRVGKTTLITAMLAESHSLLAGSAVSMRPIGPTAGKVRDNHSELLSALFQGEFNPAALGGTAAPFTYELLMAVGEGDNELGIRFAIRDYPGGWLQGEVQDNPSWQDCLGWMRSSRILMVPIDAAVLMEATLKWQRGLIPRLLALGDVSNVARVWAKEQAQQPGPQPVLMLVPLKCESYFIDNGGRRRDRAKELQRQVEHYYRGIIQAVREEFRGQSSVQILYSPIDTYGCVELKEVLWSKQAPHFQTSYKFRNRNPSEGDLSRRGVGDPVLAVCKLLIDGRKQEEAAAQASATDQATDARRQAQAHRDRAEANYGFFGNIAHFFRGTRRRERSKAQSESNRAADFEATAAEHAALSQQLAAVLESLAQQAYSDRAVKLPDQ